MKRIKVKKIKKVKKVILCADDYGQKDSISQAVLQLLAAGRLTAVSCMTVFPHWPEHARRLMPWFDRVDIGLHFAVTGEGTQYTLPHLLLQSLAGRVDARRMAIALHAQLDAFSAATGGRLPDFVDGHQHVQHFRGVREALAEVWQTRLADLGLPVRCVYDPFFWRPGRAWIKRMVLQLSGAGALKRLLVKKGIPHNSSFSGVYPFGAAHQYGNFFRQFLGEVDDRGLILCHPGVADGDAQDPLRHVRPHELAWLSGPDFPLACQAAGVRLARFRDWN